MFSSTEIVIEKFVERLDWAYRASFGGAQPECCEALSIISRTALERIADTDALYHDIEHTIMVTLVGQEILRGKMIKRGGVAPQDWLHFLAALLCHDIGYVRGVCLADRAPAFVVNQAKLLRKLPRGASDAALTPYHVDRGKLFVRERFADTPSLDVERLAAAIELTRFPVPEDGDHDETDTEAGLVRAADLIGQLADPYQLRKTTALFCEFRETGTAEKLGYTTAADLREAYPKFYWRAVRPYIGDALDYLRLTQEGKQWVANLYSHVFAVEHEEASLGPETTRGR